MNPLLHSPVILFNQVVEVLLVRSKTLIGKIANCFNY